MLYYNHLLLAAVTTSACATNLPFQGGLHTFSDFVSRHDSSASTAIANAVPKGVKLTGATRTVTTREVGSLRGAGKGEGKGKGKGGDGKGGGKGKGKGDDVVLGGAYYFTDASCTTPAAFGGSRMNHCILAENDAGDLMSMRTDLTLGKDFSIVEKYWTGTNCDGDLISAVDVAPLLGITELGTCKNGMVIDTFHELPGNTAGLLIESYLDVDSCNAAEDLVEVVFHFNGACFVDGSMAVTVNTDNCASDGYVVVTEYSTTNCDAGGSVGQFPVSPCGSLLTGGDDDDYDDDDEPTAVITSETSRCLA